MNPEHQALKAQNKAEAAEVGYDYEGAEANYRIAAAIWLQIGEMEQYLSCLDKADEMESKCEA